MPVALFQRDWEQLQSGETWGRLGSQVELNPNRPMLGIQMEQGDDSTSISGTEPAVSVTEIRGGATVSNVKMVTGSIGLSVTNFNTAATISKRKTMPRSIKLSIPRKKQDCNQYFGLRKASL